MAELFIFPADEPKVIVGIYDSRDPTAGLVIATQHELGCALPPDAVAELVQALQGWLGTAKQPVAIH